MEGNQYFEQQLRQFLDNIKDEDLVKRSKECQFILDNLLSNEVWKTVLSDAKQWVKQLDSNWQECFDEKQLMQMRILKCAYNHLFALPKKYAAEMKYINEELNKRDKTDVIEKDYDVETLLED